MLKELEQNFKIHNLLAVQHSNTLSAGVTAVNDTMANGTPPTTPPTPPLNMMTMHAERRNALLHTTTATRPTTSPTTKAMAASLLASVAAVAAANTDNCNRPDSPTVTCTPVSLNDHSEVLDHYSLRWNNHQYHIMRAFDALLQTKALVDVTLVCAEKSIHAHKMVLSACSPFFQRVFADTPCKHPIIVLKDFRGWVVQAIIDFMYRGEISVPHERLEALIQAGESLQVRGLIESTAKEQLRRQRPQTPEEFGMLNTSLFSSPDLERIRNFMNSETPTMVTSGSKMLLPLNFLRSSSSSRREREEKRRAFDVSDEQHIETETEADCDGTEGENDTETQQLIGIHSDICTSPMPRRKQARPRRRSGEFQLSPIPTPKNLSHVNTPTVTAAAAESEAGLNLVEQAETEHAKNLETLKTVIKTELEEPMDDIDDAEAPLEKPPTDANADADSGNGNDSREHMISQDLSFTQRSEPLLRPTHMSRSLERLDTEDRLEDEDDPMDAEDSNDIEDFVNNSDEIICDTSMNATEGPEDLCTTKKDNEQTNNQIMDENEHNSKHNKNSNKSVNNNNNCIELSFQDAKYLNKTFGAPMPNSNNIIHHPFGPSSLREIRLDRNHLRASSNDARNAAENQNKLDALEAQMQAAAVAAAAAANCDNPFKHMEHQVDLSLAAAAAAAAVSQHHSREREREREQAMQREQRELQQQHNMYASNLLSQMGMPGMPNFGHAAGPNGVGHERLEDSINRLNKEFDANSSLNLPNHFNMPDGPPHPSSPLPFPGMSSALALTPPHMFGLDTPLGLFPPGIDPGKLYNPLMDMPDPRGLGPEPPPFLKKKMPRPKGQHSAPRGGPPRSWTNAELTEALQHVWNKKMTTSQASRIFGIPYNSLLMYVRGKYGKSLKLEQLRKDCISGPPLELLQMGMSSHKSNSNNSNNNNNKKNGDVHENETRKDTNGSNMTPGSNTNHSLEMEMLGAPPLSNHGGPNNSSNINGGMGSNSSCPRGSSPDLMGPNSMFNPFQQGFYPDFTSGFPGLPLSMLNLLPPGEVHRHPGLGGPMHHINLDEDCKSDRSKQSSSIDEELCANTLASGSTPTHDMQPLALNRDANEAQRNCDALLTAQTSTPSSTASGNTTGAMNRSTLMNATSVQD